MTDDHSIHSINRRQFLAYSAAGAAGLLLPTQAVANSADIESLTRLHPVRFVAGLVLDVAKAVVVEFAKDTVVAALRDGHFPSITLGSTSGTESAADFRHANYKASAVVLGVADYEAYKERQLRLMLKDKEQQARYQSTLDYLKSEGIRVKLADWEISQPIGAFSPDDLFTLDYFQMDKHQEDHYRNLIAATKTTAFEHWSV